MNKPLAKALASMPKPQIKAEGNVLTLIGGIGNWWDEMDAKTVIDAINGMEGDITVRLNSPGGDVFDGITIMNALKAHDGKVTVIVEGLAASAASYIAIGGADELRMAEGAMLMIHNALTIAAGNAADLRKEADLLDKVSDNIADIYAKHCKKSKDEIKASMDAETWFTVQEAKDYGFDIVADEEEAKLENFALLQTYNHVPSVFNNAPLHQDLTKRDLEALLRDNGVSRKQAKALASKAFDSNLRDADVDSEMLEKLEQAIGNRRQVLSH